MGVMFEIVECSMLCELPMTSPSPFIQMTSDLSRIVSLRLPNLGSMRRMD